MVTTQDTWLIYGDTGLLELHEAGFQDFTVTDDQYGNPVLEQDILVQFELAVVNSSYEINENGILVGKKGLNVINKAGVDRLVFRSNSEDSIILLGEINVYNNPAELVFIGPKIYCNGCGFFGVGLVTFAIGSGNVTIASKGLSSSAGLNLFSGLVNASGPVNVGDLVLQAKDASFDLLHSKTVEAMVNGTFSFKELHATEDVFVFADKIVAGTLASMGRVKLQSKEPITIDSAVKANIAVELLSNSNVTISKTGMLESQGMIATRGQSLHVQGKLHAKKSANVTALDNVIFEPGSRLFSQGALSIENPNHEAIKLLQLNSAIVEVVGDAIIRSNQTSLKRDGDYIIERQNIPEAAYANWCGSCSDCWKWSVCDTSCYKEKLTGNWGAEPKLLIGGDLIFAGNKIDNNLGKFNVAGNKTYVGNEPEITNHKIELKIVANFKVTWDGKDHYRHNAASHARSKISSYCGIDTGWAVNGPIAKLSDTHNSVTSMERSAIALNEMEHTDIDSVNIPEAQHSQRQFVDQSLTSLATSHVYTKDSIAAATFNFNRSPSYSSDPGQPYANASYLEFDCFEEGDYESYTQDPLAVCSMLIFYGATIGGAIGPLSGALAGALVGASSCVFWHEFIANGETYAPIDSINISEERQKDSNVSIEKLTTGTVLYSEKTEEELFLELISMNENIDPSAIDYINQSLQAIKAAEERINIRDWQSNDISKWHVGKDQVREKIAEVLAVIKRAVFLSYGFYPRTIQIISMLLFYTSEHGLLAEIATGEGKTTILAGSAVLKALEGHRSLIITSSPVLVLEQSEEQKKFYDLFNISSGESIGELGNRGKECYKKTIVYGTVSSFMGDILYGNLNVAEYGAIFVDESDNMFIDQSSNIVMLAHPLSRFEYLEPLLVVTWTRLLQLVSQFYYDDDQLMWAHYQAENDTYVKTDEYLVQDADEFIFQQLVDYLNILISGPDSQVRIPAHLRDFSLKQVTIWARSAITAHNFKFDADYTFIEQPDGDLDIAPLDRHNTGVTQSNTRLSGGLHQFLQIKHNLKLSTQTLVMNFMSNVYFFKLFIGKISGTSGTLGTEEEVDLLVHMYNVDTALVPTFKHKDFIQEPAIIVSNLDWEDRVIAETLSKVKAGRAVLLVAETALQAEHFANLFLKTGYDKAKITLYNKNDASKMSGQTWFVDSGDIVVSTILTGRGTNFNTSPGLEAMGGLHVCKTYLAENIRGQLQIFYRTSRQGRKGSAQLTIALEDTIAQLEASYPWYQPQTYAIEELTEWRDLAHRQRLLRDKLCEMDMLTLRDGLFRQFNRFLDKFKNKNQDQEIHYNADVEQIKELWGSWLNEQENFSRCNIAERLDEESDFSERNANITKQVLESYAKFEADITARHNNHSLLVNPSYLTIRSLFDNSVADADRAIWLDRNFSFPSEYAKARILIGGNDKQGALSGLRNALTNIQNVMLPLYQLPLACPYVDTNGPLATQFRDKVQILSALAENIMSDISVVEQTIGQKRLHLQLVSYKALDEIFASNSKVTDEVKEFVMLGLTHFYEVGFYVEPEKKNGLFGNFLAIALGVFQIAISFALPGAGLFWASLQAGMIVGGVVDVISSSIATIQGKSIDIKQHLQGVAIGLAVNVLTAGVQVGLDKLSKVPGLSKLTKATEVGKKTVEQTSMEMLKDQIIKQTAIIGVTKSIEGVMKLGLNAYKDDIDARIRRHVHKVLEAHRMELLRIAVTDSWTGQNYAKQALIYKSYTIMSGYKDKYRKIHEKIARGVAGRIPIIGQALDAHDMASTFTEVMTVTEEFCDEFDSKIHEAVPNDEELMRAAMRHNSHKVNIFNVEPVMFLMQDTGMIQNSRFSYANNTNAHNATVPLLEAMDKVVLPAPMQGEKERVKQVYERVANLDSPENQAQYNQALDQIEKEVASVVTKRITTLVRNGILTPLAALAASPVMDAIGKVISAQQAKHAEKITAANSNNPAKSNKSKKNPNPIPGDSTNGPSNGKPKGGKSAGKITGKLTSNAVSFEEFKRQKLRYSADIESSSYAKDRGGFSYIDAAMESLPMSEPDIKKEYNSYLSNHLYIEDQKQVIVNTAKSQLQQSEQRDYGWQALKTADQIYIVWKMAAKGSLLVAEDTLNDISPNTYTEIRDKSSKFGKVVGLGIQKTDGKLQSLFGKSYANFKSHTGVFLTEFNKNAPEYAQDITAMLLGEGILGGALKGAGAAIKGANKLTNAGVTATARAARKIATAADNILPPLAAAVAPGVGSVRLGSMADDITRIQNAFHSVADDTLTKTGGRFDAGITKVNTITPEARTNLVESINEVGATARPKPKYLSDDSLKIKDVKLQAKLNDMIEQDLALWKNFEAGTLKRSEWQVHHMISKESKQMLEHSLWKQSGLNPESGINKVLLPKHTGVDPIRSLHNGRHTDFHHKRLLRLMEDVQRSGKKADWSPEQFKQGLQALLLTEREALLNGKINLYDKGGMK